MLDFSGIVLIALQNTFSRPITVTPHVSQPGGSPYTKRGVYSTSPVDITAEMNLVLSDQKTMLWIRLAEYPIPPLPGDQIDIPAYLTAPAEGQFEIQDVDRHADGKVILILKKPLQ